MKIISSKKAKNVKTSILSLTFLILSVSTLVAAPKPVTAKYIPELKKEFRNFDSHHWNKAGVIKDFKVAVEDKDSIPAAQSTEVRLANDGDNLIIKITALDTDMSKIKAVELDEFENSHPKGDHVELWIGSSLVVLAFDSIGNKYEARAFDRHVYSTKCKSLTRKTKAGWEIVAIVPILKLITSVPIRKLRKKSQGKLPSFLSLNFIRHLDHGLKKPERSTASGGKPWNFMKLKIEKNLKQEKK